MRARIRKWVTAAQSNERRWTANQELKWLADHTYPWTEEALRAAVRKWLNDE